jgi:hypothetical protein
MAISRFSVEGWSEDKEELAQELALVCSRFVAVMKMEGDPNDWECIVDRIRSKARKGKFHGMMMMERQEDDQ